MFTRNQQLNPKTLEKTPPKKLKLRRWRCFLQQWIYWCFLGPCFGGGVGLGRQEKVKFYIILFFFFALFVFFSPWMVTSGSGWWECGNNVDLHLATAWTHNPVSKDCGDHTLGDGEGQAAGKCSWFLSLLGFFSFIFEIPNINWTPNINCQGPQSCLQAQTLPEGPRGCQPTWKQQKMSRSQKIS